MTVKLNYLFASSYFCSLSELFHTSRNGIISHHRIQRIPNAKEFRIKRRKVVLGSPAMPEVSSHCSLNFKSLQLNSCTSNVGDYENLQACTFIVLAANILNLIDLTVQTSQL